MKEKQNIHIIGIGGIGTSALARWFLANNYKVSGSDICESEITEDLKKIGVSIYVGHKTSNLNRKTILVIHSAAISGENPEIKIAKKLKIDIKSYSQTIGRIIKKYPKIFKKNKPAQEPFDLWGFESLDGWHDLIDITAAKIQQVLDKNNNKDCYFYTVQNKQKLSTMRWYFESDDINRKTFEEIINKAEKESGSICENCGTKENVSQNKRGYILTLCNACRKIT